MVNKWLIILIILVGVAGIIYGINATITVSNTAKIKENQDYIIKTLNDSENQRQLNKIAILNNMSAEIEKVRQDAHANRDALAKLLENQNISISFANGTHPNATGRVSGFGQVQIIH